MAQTSKQSHVLITYRSVTEWRKTDRARLRHRKHIYDTDGVVVDKLSEHQTHNLHRHTRTAMFQHLHKYKLNKFRPCQHLICCNTTCAECMAATRLSQARSVLPIWSVFGYLGWTCLIPFDIFKKDLKSHLFGLSFALWQLCILTMYSALVVVYTAYRAL